MECNLEELKQRCIEAARHHRTMNAFKTNKREEYKIAEENGWLEEFDWLGVRKTPCNKKWVYETCYEEAKKYSSRKKFYKGSGSAYGVALQNKWLDDYYWFHRPAAHNKIWKFDDCQKEFYRCKGDIELLKEQEPRCFEAMEKNEWLKEIEKEYCDKN